MIYGVGIAAKYSRIIEGFRAETNLSAATPEQKVERVYEFTKLVKNATPKDFEEWYQLYSSMAPLEGRKKRAATVHTRRD